MAITALVTLLFALAPAVVALLDRWNWWLPDWAARILRVEPSSAQSEETPAPAPQTA